MRKTVIKRGVSYALDHVITTGGNCTAEGPCYYEEICPTMKAAGAHAVATTKGAADSSTGIQRIPEALDSSGRNVRRSDPPSSRSLSKQKVSVKTESEILCLNDQGGSVMHIHYGITEPLRAQMKHHEPIVLVYDARGNGGGGVTPTITGDHQDRVTDYTAVVVEKNEDADGKTVL